MDRRERKREGGEREKKEMKMQVKKSTVSF